MKGGWKKKGQRAETMKQGGIAEQCRRRGAEKTMMRRGNKRDTDKVKLNSVVQKNSSKRRREASKSIFRGLLADNKAKTLNSGGS